MNFKHIHLIGIGGISMSGIAEVLLNKGYKVTGSDMKENELLDKLRKLGAQIFIGHNQNNVCGADVAVYSSAIPDDNVELEYARQQNLIIWKRAEMIAHLIQEKKGIAVSGTHGKTTTTAMISYLLKKGGYDPTVLLGGKLDILEGNACVGEGNYFITEADESDGSLLYFKPEVSVITNIELDHHDYYNNQEELLSTFKNFIQNTRETGISVLNADDPSIQKIIENISEVDILTFGLNRGQIQAKDVNLLPFGSFFTVIYQEQELGEINLQVPGLHNVKNAMACIAVCIDLNMNFVEIKTIIENFSGVKRRFEKKGLIEDILVIDDYAHHPTEIKETLKAAQNTGYERIIAVFQPHRYTRTHHLLQEFSRSFELVDELIVTTIYGAGESPIKGVSSEKLVEKIKNNNDINVKYIEDFDHILEYLQKIVKSRDLILTIGAGDVYKVGERFIELNS